MNSARIFASYGYNERDRWIEDRVFPLLESLGFQVLQGKDMHGDVLQDAIKQRIDQCDALVAFSTIRESVKNEQFNTHPWVRDELTYALGRQKPILEVREEGVNKIEGLAGNRQYIKLDPRDRLSCAVELVVALRKWGGVRLQLVPENDNLFAEIRQAIANEPAFAVQYRSRIDGVDSNWQHCRLERIKGGLYMYVFGIPSSGLIEIKGGVNGTVLFSSDWEAVDAIQITVT